MTHMININRGSLANAMNALAHDHRGEYAIGRIREEHSGLSAYKIGDFVFVRDERGGTVTLDMPMSPDAIAAEQAKGSLLTTFCTIINVPSKFVEVVLDRRA